MPARNYRAMRGNVYRKYTPSGSGSGETHKKTDGNIADASLQLAGPEENHGVRLLDSFQD
jgi:hypothetical protein